MTIDTKDILNSILSSISRIDYIKPEDIPGIDLYMDQVTTFMESHMASSKRYEEDKVLTKTMINNYAKNHLLPAPVKKKYSKEHILMLTFIYYFKNLLSINDIQTLLDPIAERFFSGEGSISENELYPVNRFCGNDTLCLSELSGGAGFCLQALCQAQERNAVLWRRLKLSHMRKNIGIRYAESMIRHEEWN